MHRVAVTFLCLWSSIALAAPLADVASAVSVTPGTEANFKVLTIRNDSDHGVTALLYTADIHSMAGGREVAPSHVYRYIDSAAGGWKGVPPHSTASVRVANGDVNADIAFKAGILDNGAPFGDPAWASRIPQYRQMLVSAYSAAIATIDKALSENMAASTVVQQCKSAISTFEDQRVKPSTPENWGAEISRYSLQITRDVNNRIIKAVSGLPDNTLVSQALKPLRTNYQKTVDMVMRAGL